jgi:ribosomal protein S18 acetylase RimI-like enzyme
VYEHPLDNPIWSGLTGPHAHLAVGDGRVRRYRADVAMFVAVENPLDPDMPGLLDLIGNDTVGFVTIGPVSLPHGVEVVRIADVLQMVVNQWKPVPVTLDIHALGEADERQMVELVDITKPGPFAPRARLMGEYRGLFDNGRLIAMSGERMRTSAFTEISAVCTHPDYRGRGYAKQFVSVGGNEIILTGKTPFLHVYADNALAIATYEKLGFVRSRMMRFTVIKRR